MKILEKFLALSRLRQIALAVCLAHLLAIFAMAIHHFATRRLRPEKPIAVRTLSARPPQSIAATAPFAPPKPASAPKKEAPKPKAPPPAAKTQPAKKPLPQKPAPPKEKTPASDAALKEIAESLQSLAAPAEAAPSRPALSLPAALSKSPAPKMELSETPNLNLTYGEVLTAYLQEALDLPEYGDVKLEIEIDRLGNPVRCAVLDSKSVKNSEFLKNRLPELSFPCFNDFQIADSTLTFTITFRNAETR